MNLSTAPMSTTPTHISAEPAGQPNASASSGRIQKRAIAISTAPLNGMVLRDTSGRPENQMPATAPANESAARRASRISGPDTYHGIERPQLSFADQSQ